MPGEHALVVPPLLPPDDAVGTLCAAPRRPGRFQRHERRRGGDRGWSRCRRLPLRSNFRRRARAHDAAADHPGADERALPPARVRWRARRPPGHVAAPPRLVVDLLSAADRAALAQLGLRGRLSRSTPPRPCSTCPPGTDAPWPADALQSLVDKSWLRNGADGRFELLVSVIGTPPATGCPGSFLAAARLRCGRRRRATPATTPASGEGACRGAGVRRTRQPGRRRSLRVALARSMSVPWRARRAPLPR